MPWLFSSGDLNPLILPCFVRRRLICSIRHLYTHSRNLRLRELVTRKYVSKLFLRGCRHRAILHLPGAVTLPKIVVTDNGCASAEGGVILTAVRENRFCAFLTAICENFIILFAVTSSCIHSPILLSQQSGDFANADDDRSCTLLLTFLGTLPRISIILFLQ